MPRQTVPNASVNVDTRCLHGAQDLEAAFWSAVWDGDHLVWAGHTRVVR